MAKVSFSPRSRTDLLEIGDHIAQDSRESARRFVARLIAQCQRIGRAPMGYPGREDLAAGLRMAPMGNYVIFFRIVEGVVRIERVLHGARDFPTVMAPAERPEE